MKIILLSSLLISFNVFAIDFNKVNGTFFVAHEKKNEQIKKERQEVYNRTPASVVAETNTQSNSKK